MYSGYITTQKNVHKHSNADRLQVGECFGNQVIVSLDYTEGQQGVYFPSDGQQSVEFCEANNLLRKKDENGKNIGGYMDPDKRNVTAIRLRGEKSDGIFLPLSSLSSFGDIDSLQEGMKIDTFNGHLICQKYIPRTNGRGHGHGGNKTRKHAQNIAPLFQEHADTEQLAYNLDAFKPGDQIEITLKLHGTSGRTAHLPVLKSFKRSIADRIFRRPGKPVYSYGYVSGTRRTVLEDYEGGYYGSNEFREQHSKFFEGKLWKGETVYYEIVGFVNDTTPIMASADNRKTNDPEFVAQYGDTTVFSYGCEPSGLKTLYGRDDEGLFAIETHVPQSDLYVYRMTMTNEDGDVVEYTPDFMRYRCEQMGAKTVPVFAKVVLPDAEYFDDEHNAGEYVKAMAEQYYDGTDPIGKTHIREGVVVRIVNRPKFTAYKHKNWYFKCLEGLVKAEATAPDMEESDESVESEN